ncbi:unnamed protein product [Umbelopsis vinacea]
MAQSKHHHVGIKQGDTEKPPREHVERTRDVFRDGKVPVIKQQAQPVIKQQAQPEAKVQSRRAPPEKQPARKKERKTVAEYDDGEGAEQQEEELSDEEKKAKDLAEHEEQITYSNYYYDDEFEYRHVTLPKEIAHWLPHHGLLAEEEWRSLGVKQSLGWEHYMIHGKIVIEAFVRMDK